MPHIFIFLNVKLVGSCTPCESVQLPKRKRREILRADSTVGEGGAIILVCMLVNHSFIQYIIAENQT